MSEEVWQTLIQALGLLLVVEGIGPFIAPAAWRHYIVQALRLSDRGLRCMGLVLMCLGLLVLKFVL